MKCPSCGYENLLGGPTCSQCGAALSPGGSAPPLSGPDAEYQRLLRDRARAKARTQKLTAAAVVAIVGLGAYFVIQDRNRKARKQALLDFVDRWIDLDKRESASFWDCITGSATPIDTFTSAQQVQAKVEVAYASQPKTYAEHVRRECLPRLERAKSAFADMTDVPEPFTEPLESYAESLTKLGNGIENYLENLASRAERQDLDELIQEAGNAWHSSYTPTPDSIAFDKFLACAVPGYAKLKDAQALLEVLASECFKRDATAFMAGVRDRCGPILANIDKAAKPAPNYASNMKKFYEEDRRMMSAWTDCGKRARKGDKANDLEQFLHATAEHMKARARIGKIGREIEESL